MVQASGRWTHAWIGVLVLQGLLPVALVYLTRAVVNAVAAALGRGSDWQNALPIVWSALGFAGVLVATELLRSLDAWIRANQAERIRMHLARLIQRQSVAVDLAFYETPEYFDSLHRARFEAQERPVLLLEQCGALIQASISLLAMVSLLLSIAWWLPVILLFSTAPAFYVVSRAAIRQYRWRVETTPERRLGNYYDYVVADSSTAAEMRIFSLGDFFSSAHQRILEMLRVGSLRLLRTEKLSQLWAVLLSLVLAGAALGWMVWRAMVGQASLGDIAFFYQAFNQGQGLMRSVLQQAGQLYGNVLFLSDLHRFMSLEPQIVDPPEPKLPRSRLSEGICFDNVSFSYPGTQRPVLDGFSLEIPAGKMVAIVGVNGAGKTTLIKLLCRLYDPHGGRIMLDDTDIREFSVAAYRGCISVLFQQPARYDATVAQNIAFGNWAKEESREEIIAAAKAAGAHQFISRLPSGYDTLLGKRFRGGHELSVGEWQRLCLARAILRDAPLILLDEPTAAMDAWSEANWLTRFREHTIGRTVLLITHRFTTAMRADLIYVMDAGSIVEQGSHETLLAGSGKYAASWARQVGRHSAESRVVPA